MADCCICYETIKPKAKRFVCLKCHCVICIPCFKEIIQRGLYVPTCPSCRTALNYDYIVSITSKTYFKTQYMDHLADIQFRMLTEQTIQVLYPLIYKINQIRDLHITKLDIRAAFLYKQEFKPENETFAQRYFIYPNILLDFLEFINNNEIVNNARGPNQINIEYVCDELSRIQKMVPNDIFKDFLKQHWNVDEHSVNITKEIEGLIKKKGDNKNVAKCELCRLGIIIEHKNADKIEYICNTCNQKYCTKCLIKLNEESHICKQEDIDSWEEIKASTKLCPKCASRIFRSMGCPQMFCTNCHTGFDWNTGEVINGNFHNPHRMEWLRNGGRDDVRIDTCNDIGSIVNDGKVEFKGKSIKIPYYNELLKLLNYHNELIDVMAKYNRDYNRYSTINYYNLLMWYYRNEDLPFLTKINVDGYKKNIRYDEEHKFKLSTILSIITPIVDIIHDGILTIINICRNKNIEEHVNDSDNSISQSENLETEFANTSIKIIKFDKDNYPKYFNDIMRIFANMISELVLFDNNLYSAEKIVELQSPHFQFYSIDDGYSIHLDKSGFETNYQLYFILNELTIINDGWNINYNSNKDVVDKYVVDLLTKYPLAKINKNSKSAETLKCKFLLSHYKSKLLKTNVIYTGYLTELQKVIIVSALDNKFDFDVHTRPVRRRG